MADLGPAELRQLQGLAQEVTALRPAAGADRMLVACLGAPAYPAARNLYSGVGFRELSRDVPQIKTAS